LQLEKHFPIIWMPTPENRDLRQLLWHRHRLVQMRTRIMNQLQAVAMNEGKRWKKKTVQRTGTSTVGEVAVSSLWVSSRTQPAPSAGRAWQGNGLLGSIAQSGTGTQWDGYERCNSPFTLIRTSNHVRSCTS
jgi:hypothetical protein